MLVKVCGIQSVEEARWAIDLGYDAIGIVRYPHSPRYVDEDTARKIIDSCGKDILTVAVSLKFADVQGLIDAVDFIQIYETAEMPKLILAGSEPPAADYYKYFLFDSSKGSGEKEKFPGWLVNYRDRLIIAGGLDYRNVAEVVKSFRPAGVDVSSGVEAARGKKDFILMKYFIREARNAVS